MNNGFCGLVWSLVVEFLTSMHKILQMTPSAYTAAVKVGSVGLLGCLVQTLHRGMTGVNFLVC